MYIHMRKYVHAHVETTRPARSRVPTRISEQHIHIKNIWHTEEQHACKHSAHILGTTSIHKATSKAYSHSQNGSHHAKFYHLHARADTCTHANTLTGTQTRCCACLRACCAATSRRKRWEQEAARGGYICTYIHNIYIYIYIYIYR
jgi:hypothetical protein